MFDGVLPAEQPGAAQTVERLQALRDKVAALAPERYYQGAIFSFTANGETCGCLCRWAGELMVERGAPDLSLHPMPFVAVAAWLGEPALADVMAQVYLGDPRRPVTRGREAQDAALTILDRFIEVWRLRAVSEAREAALERVPELAL